MKMMQNNREVKHKALQIAFAFAIFSLIYMVTKKMNVKKNISLLSSIGGGILAYFYGDTLINDVSYNDIEMTETEPAGEKGTIKIGDKGKIIEVFQTNAEKLMGTKSYFDNKGMYDRRTKKYVISVFAGSSDLINEETGQVKIEAIENFNTIVNNSFKDQINN